jgi:hypothetical protein
MAAVLILAPRGEDDRLDAHAPTPLRRVCDDRVQHLLGLHAGGKPFDDAVGLVADDRPENHASSLARLAAGVFGPWASWPTHLWGPMGAAQGIAGRAPVQKPGARVCRVTSRPLDQNFDHRPI